MAAYRFFSYSSKHGQYPSIHPSILTEGKLGHSNAYIMPGDSGLKGISRWLLPVRIEGEDPTTNFRPTAIRSTFFSRKQVKWLFKTPDKKPEADKRAAL